MNFLKTILAILGLWLAPLSPPPITFPVATTSTTVPAPVTTTSVPIAVTTSIVSVSTTLVDAPADDIWWQLALCEDGGRNRQYGPFHGYFHFMLETWWGVGGTGNPEDHSYEEQKYRAQILQRRSGWGQWPGCRAKLGL